MRWPYILSLVALLGAALLLFFNILCGATNHAPLNKWYWLEADTSSIPGANSVTRWTNYNSCGVSGGHNTDCSSKHAAYPMSPVSNFGTTEGVPSGLSSKHGSTYYLSKVGWAFLLIGLFFTLLALLPVLVSFCIPSLTILNVGTGFATSAALLFTALSAALLTAGYVKARNAFRDDGRTTHLGKTMLAFIWTSTFLLALSSLFSGVGCCGNFFGNRKKKRTSENYDSSSHETYGNDYTHEKVNSNERRGFFGRSKKTKNEDLEDVGYAAGLGASGATSDCTKGRNVPSGTNANANQASTGDDGHGLGYAAAGAAAGAGVLGASKMKQRDPQTGKYIDDTTIGTDSATRDPATGENIDDVAYAAGLGASGATSDYSKNKATSASKSKTEDPSKVGYAAGLGASGATSDYTKNKGTTGTTGTGYGSKSKTGENTDDVGYAAGYGASGATSDYTKGGSGTGYGSSSGYGSGAALGTAGAAGAALGYGASHKDGDKTTTSGTYGSSTTGSGAYANTGSTDYNAKTGESLDDVAYAAGYGASGATSDYNKNSSKGYDSKDYGNTYGTSKSATTGTGAGTTDTYVPASKPYDTEAATTGATTDTASSPSQSKGIWASAAAALGIGGAAAASGSNKNADGTDKTGTTGATDSTGYGNSASGPGYEYNEDNTVTGAGATRYGANAVKEDKSKKTLENKSTVLPVGTENKHVASDPYGNKTDVYTTGVPDDAARSAATASAVGGVTAGGATAAGDVSKGTYKPVYNDPATRAEDTYNNSNIGQGKTHKDLTTTSGYEPTSYYTRNTGESGIREKGDDVAKSAGFASIGGTSENTKDKSTSKTKGEPSGYGADSGTSGYNKSSTGEYHDSAKSGNKDSSHLGTGAGAAGAAGLGAAALSSHKNKDKPTASDSYGKTSGSKDSTGYGDSYGTSTSGKNKSTTATGSQTRDPTTGENLKDVAYAAGLGASGATSDYSKNKGTSASKSKTEDPSNVGYAAGLGASGATSDYTKNKDTSGSKKSKTGTGYEDLSDVGYSAGLGASGATSDYTKSGSKSDTGRKSGIASWFGKNKRDSSTSSVYDDEISGTTGQQTDENSSSKYGTAAGIAGVGATAAGISDYTKRGSGKDATTGKTSSGKTTSSTGEKLEDVAYAAGYGSSGATSKYTDPKYDTSKNKSTGSSSNAYGSSSKDKSSTGKTAAGAATGAAVGAAAGDSYGHKQSTDSSKYDSTSKNDDDSKYGYDSKNAEYDSTYGHGKSSSSGNGLKDAVVDPSRNRNPIAEGLVSGDVGKPNGLHEEVYASKVSSNTADKLHTPYRGVPGDDLPGSFPASNAGAAGVTGSTATKTSTSNGSPTQTPYTGGLDKSETNYTTGSGYGTGSSEPRTYKDDGLRDLETKQQEGESPSIMKQIVDTAKTVV